MAKMAEEKREQERETMDRTTLCYCTPIIQASTWHHFVAGYLLVFIICTLGILV